MFMHACRKDTNGYNSGSHGFGDKVIPYEEGSKAPLIIYDPRLPTQHAGEVCEAVTANVDMTATIFALAGVPAPEGIDGRSLLPLLTGPSGQVREWLPLFNFWGTVSAQSMAVVSREWKYIYWYYDGKRMRPTEELFHLSQDRIEMTNVVAEPRYAVKRAATKRAYDAELTAIRARAVKNHESYSILFDRSVPWDQKAPLLGGKKGRGGNDEEENPPGKAGKEPAKKRRGKKGQEQNQ